MQVPPLVEGPVAFPTPLLHSFPRYPLDVLVDLAGEFECALVERAERVLVRADPGSEVCWAAFDDADFEEEGQRVAVGDHQVLVGIFLAVGLQEARPPA